MEPGKTSTKLEERSVEPGKTSVKLEERSMEPGKVSAKCFGDKQEEPSLLTASYYIDMKFPFFHIVVLY